MKLLYDLISEECSKNITRRYSTSFSLGIRFLAREFRGPVYAIYGFVRLADEIVDSFEGFEQAAMLRELEEDTFRSLENGISINPVLNAFQHVVHRYDIDTELIAAFLESMAMDLQKQVYTRSLYEKYIYGSAEVVGLMCLKVFCRGDGQLYERLRPAAMKLGAAFQKINFLRDIRTDYEGLGRMYFPGTDFGNFCNAQKSNIEADIAADFAAGYEGIRQLPADARFGVYLAYVYYKRLFKKIQAIPGERILQARVRIPDYQKIYLLFSSLTKSKLNLI